MYYHYISLSLVIPLSTTSLYVSPPILSLCHVLSPMPIKYVLMILGSDSQDWVNVRKTENAP